VELDADVITMSQARLVIADVFSPLVMAVRSMIVEMLEIEDFDEANIPCTEIFFGVRLRYVKNVEFIVIVKRMTRSLVKPSF
jgi:hypothetical protein